MLSIGFSILNTPLELWYRKPINNCFWTSLSQKIKTLNSFQPNVPFRGHKKKTRKQSGFNTATPKFGFVNINVITPKNNLLHPN